MRRLIIRFNSFPSWAFDLGSPPDFIWFLFFYVFRSGYFCTAVSDIYFGRMIMALYLFQVKLKIVVLMENKSPVFLSTERVFGFFSRRSLVHLIWTSAAALSLLCHFLSADMSITCRPRGCRFWPELVRSSRLYILLLLRFHSQSFFQPSFFFILKHFDNDVSCFEMLLFWWQFNY